MKLSEIADKLEATIRGDADREIVGVASLSGAGENELSFLSERKFLRDLRESSAGAVIIEPGLADSSFAQGKNLLLVSDVDSAVDRAAMLFAPEYQQRPKGIHPRAFVHEGAKVPESASIGPFCVVEDGALVGENTVLVCSVHVGRKATIGAECTLYQNCVVGDSCVLGDRVIMHACSEVGSDGFGYRFTEGRHNKIPQLGVVVVEHDVEIGSCSCIDRARFGQTRIGCGTKIDNLCQIAHNVQIGSHVIMAGQCGVAGSSKVGDYVVMGGKVAVRDHVEIGPRSTLAGGAGVTKDIPPGIIVSGIPAEEHREQLRQQANVRRLPQLKEQIRKLEKRVEELEAETKHRREEN